MAKPKGSAGSIGSNSPMTAKRVQQRKNKRTSIGSSKNSKPTHKQFSKHH